MKREEFKRNLEEATRSAFEFGKRFSEQTLPSKIVFDVYPNQSCDENPLKEGEEVYPEDSLEFGEFIGMDDQNAVVDLLWRNGKVPEWIDINVESTRGDQTCMRLLCCGRFTASINLLYHRKNGFPPFSIKSPDHPPGFNFDGNAGVKKFDLNWKQKRKMPK